MATLFGDDAEFAGRKHDLDYETRRDRVRFAAWLIVVMVIVTAALAAGVANVTW